MFEVVKLYLPLHYSEQIIFSFGPLTYSKEYRNAIIWSPKLLATSSSPTFINVKID